MLKRLNNKYLMFVAVKQVLDRNAALWQSIAALAAIINEFFQKLDKTGETQQLTEISSKGTTQEKNREEELLVDQIYEMASALYTMAVRTGNEILQQKAGYTEGELQTAREGELVVTGESVAAMARENLAALAEYDIDEAKVNALEEQTALFSSKVSTPRADIAIRKAANARLREEFDELTDLLEHQLDRMMVRFRKTDPDFYAAYINARIIVDHGLRHEKNGEEAAA